jgi:hypothetical protein
MWHLISPEVLMMEEERPRLSPGEIAGRLISAIEEERLHTEGEWNDWIRQMKKIPAWWRKWVLKKVKKYFTESAFEHLKKYLEW